MRPGTTDIPVKINHLPAGTDFNDSLTLGSGETGTIDLSLAMVSHAAFEAFHLILFEEGAGDDDQALSSLAIRSSSAISDGIFVDGFESGDFSAWSSVTTP